MPTIQIDFDPFPAVRSNRNSWNKKTTDYHTKMNALRAMLLLHSKEIISAMVEARYSITFVMPMADSWGNKKRIEHDQEYHTQKPDIDNLYKAFLDTLFYKKKVNDCEVPVICASKIWGDKWAIIVDIL